MKTSPTLTACSAVCSGRRPRGEGDTDAGGGEGGGGEDGGRGAAKVASAHTSVKNITLEPRTSHDSSAAPATPSRGPGAETSHVKTGAVEYDDREVKNITLEPRTSHDSRPRAEANAAEYDDRGYVMFLTRV